MKNLPYMFLAMLMGWNAFAQTPDENKSDENKPNENESEEIANMEVLEPDWFLGQNLPKVERTVNISTAKTTRPGSILMIIDHRTGKPFLDAGFQDYLGLDSGGLKIGLGLRYGIMDGVDAGFYRLNGTVEAFDTYEFDARWQFMNQENVWFNAALRAGVSWFVQPGQDAVGAFGQLLLDRVFFDRLLLCAGLLIHSESSNDMKAITDDSWSMAAVISTEVRITSWFAIDLETSMNLAGYTSKYPVFALGFKLLTYRHTFSLVLSNNQYMNADGIVSNTWRGFGDMVLGFQITREFNL